MKNRTFNLLTLLALCLASFTACAQWDLNPNYAPIVTKYPTNKAVFIDAQTGERVTSGADSNAVKSIVRSEVQSATNVQAYGSITVSNTSGAGRTFISSTDVTAGKFIGYGSLLTGISPGTFGGVSTNAATNYVAALLSFTNNGLVYYIPLLRTNVGGSALVLTNGTGGGGGGSGDPGAGILWAKLDESSGNTATDSSSTANDGYKNISIIQPAGKFGNCYTSAAGDRNVIFSDIAAYDLSTGSFSLSLWVKYTDATGFKYVMQLNDESNGGNGLGILRVGAALRCSTPDGQVDTASLNDNNWHNIIMVRSGSTTTVYVDGSSAGTISGASQIPQFPSIKVLSLFSATDSTSLFTGSIDDVRLAKTAWNGTTITWLQTNP